MSILWSNAHQSLSFNSSQHKQGGKYYALASYPLTTHQNWYNTSSDRLDGQKGQSRIYVCQNFCPPFCLDKVLTKICSYISVSPVFGPNKYVFMNKTGCKLFCNSVSCHSFCIYILLNVKLSKILKTQIPHFWGNK